MKKLVIVVIVFVSGCFRLLGLRACRYSPSCSEYSIEAFKEFGFFTAFFLMTKRILSCHPFSEGGYQPLK